jgi:lysozyme
MVRRRKGKLGISIVVLAGAGAIAAYMLWRGAARREQPVATPHECQLGPTTPGIDVSYYQGDIAWNRVHNAGVQFAFIRVSDGADIFDVKFEANWLGARRAKILRGAYQFFRPEESPIDQANIMVRTLRQHGRGELPPVIDIEVTSGLPLAVVAQNAKIWIEHVRSQLGVEPIVYTNPGMWSGSGEAAPLATQPLWLAHYTEACPRVPSPWTRWTYWQYTENGRVAGIDGPVDLDLRQH